MNVRNLILGIMLSALLAGCRQAARNDTYLELMGAQRRALEDRIYDLEFDAEEMTAELERLQKENQQLRQNLDGSGDGTLPGLEIDPGTPGNGSATDDGTLPGIPRIKIDPGDPVDKAPQQDPQPADPNTDFELLPAPKNSGTNPGANVQSATVSHIVLDPNRTGITSFDEQNNNDGVIISLEPRNRNDQYVNKSGASAIVVLDPAQTGQSARIARWDISRADVQRILDTPGESNSITLELPWPATPPKSTDLLLFVRYETADGHKFETHTRITGKPTGVTTRQPTTETSPTSPVSSDDFPVSPSLEATQFPPATLRIPSAARQATSQPATDRSGRPQWRPYR